VKEILNSKWDYILYQKENKLLLSVVSGTVGLFDRNIYLTDQEGNSFESDGEVFIKKLAKDINNDPSKYESRHVKSMSILNSVL
jgi:hypothetical protein